MSAKPAPRRIPTADDLARAVELFHGRGPWTDEKQAEWNQVTGSPATETRAMSCVLLDMARDVREAAIRIDLGPEVTK